MTGETFEMLRRSHVTFGICIDIFVHTKYAGGLQSSDLDVRATAARIKQFVMEHAYRDPPEGSELPEYDQSADLAC